MCQKALEYSTFLKKFAEKALFGNWKADRTKLDKPFDQCQKETTVFCFVSREKLAQKFFLVLWGNIWQHLSKIVA